MHRDLSSACTEICDKKKAKPRSCLIDVTASLSISEAACRTTTWTTGTALTCLGLYDIPPVQVRFRLVKLRQKNVFFISNRVLEFSKSWNFSPGVVVLLGHSGNMFWHTHVAPMEEQTRKPQHWRNFPTLSGPSKIS